jgi:hypothetical protein
LFKGSATAFASISSPSILRVRAAIGMGMLAAFAAEFSARYGAGNDIKRASSRNEEAESK